MLILCGMGTVVGVGNAGAATNEVSGLLQQGLFEEEANHNLDAAIAAYQSVITRAEKDRQFEATAVFRLGECYRKLGRTNEANVQYQRILAEFADQTDLATLSRSYLGSAAVSSTPPALNAANQKQQELLAEQIKLEQQELDRQENLVKNRILPESDTVPTREKLLELQRQLAAMQSGGVTSQAAVDPGAEELRRIQALIKDSPDLINGAPNQPSPLLLAVQRNYLSVARFLLDNKADVNKVSSGHGYSALNEAAANDNKPMVELLVDHNANINDTTDVMNNGGLAPLHHAVENGDKTLVEFLLAHGADVNIRTSQRDGLTPLHLAAQKGFLTVAELLLSHGADVNAQDANGHTPLHLAARDDNSAIMDLLIAHHADVDAKDRSDGTPLLFAAQRSSLRAVRLLLTNGANVNAQGHSVTSTGGTTALAWAVENARPDIAKLLLESHADPDLGSAGNETPLMRAAEKNELDMVQLLLSHGADVNARMSGGQLDRWTPLYFAIDANAPEIITLLLENKADPNAVADNLFTTTPPSPGFGGPRPVRTVFQFTGSTPLLFAVRRSEEETVRILLAHKANPNLADASKTTPLIEAMRGGNAKLPELLIQSGANVNAQNENHDSALSLAVTHHQTDLLPLILAHHPNLEVLDPNGYSPLQLAVHGQRPVGSFGEDLVAVRLLLDAGADPDAFNPNVRFNDPSGYCPMGALEGAVLLGDRPMVELLLAHHANPNVLDSQGRTPLSWALSLQAETSYQRPNRSTDAAIAEIVELLRKAGANENLQRLSTISISRGWSNATVEFKKGTNAFSHYTLFELLDSEYAAQLRQPGSLNLNPRGLEFPDFGKIKISRVQPGGKTNLVNVNLDAAFAAGDCSADVPLQWGDIVEIPESDHILNETWHGLGRPVAIALANCLQSKIDIVVAGKSNAFTLRPGFPSLGTGFGDQSLPASSHSQFWLGQVVTSANVLLTSSDLSRVTVKRHDPASGKTIAMIFDLSPGNGTAEALWLRDGDVIEIPDKP